MLISSLGSKIESVAEIVAESSSSRRVEPLHSGPSHRERGKAAARSVLFALGADDKKEENDVKEENAGEVGSDGGDDYVSHNLYRDIIA